ncbi:FecCD family ABC transporter permease [Streptomyces smyrnaeus]|uniref:FecCD family ABC transporter permease n=1 Tax=Streptomyces TaxID=1883 RepID=UPI000C1932D3|nr:iron chelate uptake ABC transporter family permease subunit [Streptomyces sp. RK75]MBQ0868599.1 iron chelate uptake ABC transporter family permease subunit [Streptomyces sp. RK75]MBQ1159796.1 iron chelate uptake ABC transporter family permease subunit [Streptomyces sp. A73]
MSLTPTRESVIRTPGGLSVNYRPRALLVGIGCLVLALVAAVFAIGSGEYPMAPGDVVRTLLGGGDTADAFIVNELRLPRTVTALLVGAGLGLCGAVFQAVVRNPLGSPDILGFTNGAAAGALLVIFLAGGSSALLAGGAVAGAVVTGTLIYALAWKRGMHGYRLVLVGVGATAILTGVNSYLITRAGITEASRAVLWMTGSLDGRGWDDVMPLVCGMVVLVPLVLLGCGRALRMMEMGDDAAYALGVRVERVRLTLLAAGVLLVALSAAAAGPVSFVALTAPQLARRLTKAPGPNLLPSLCMGAALLICADLVAQRAFGEHQLPVGVITGVLGGGYLVWLLATERRAGRI